MQSMFVRMFFLLHQDNAIRQDKTRAQKASPISSLLLVNIHNIPDTNVATTTVAHSARSRVTTREIRLIYPSSFHWGRYPHRTARSEDA